MSAGVKSIRKFWLWHARSETDTVAWNAVYTRELPRIYNYFRYRFGDNAVAEDLTSTTFEKAWRGRERYRRDLAAFSTWLLTIARNVATDHLRRAHIEIPLDTLVEVPANDPPDAVYARRAELAQLTRLLAQLPDRERELIAFKYGAELNNRQIAQLTGLSESNVGTILHRAVGRLREGWDRDERRMTNDE